MSSRDDASGFLLRDLAERAGATLVGDGSVLIDRVAVLDHAEEGAIAFLSNPSYRRQLAATRASAVILASRDADATTLPKLVTPNPYVVYARVSAILNPPRVEAAGLHASAIVAAGTCIPETSMIGPHVVIGRRVAIGQRTQIHAGSVIGDDCSIGDDCVLYPRVVVYPGTTIGKRAIIHSGAVIGADGFGMADDNGHWLKVPQLGRVIIGDDVEIGANTTIDRGAIEDTLIADDVKLDNQIQVGHNSRIGRHTAIAGCVGIAGSTRIGANCQLGGAAMVSGHLSIADGTIISAATFVGASIDKPGVYTGSFPLLPHREWQYVGAILRRLRTLANRLRALERSTDAKGE